MQFQREAVFAVGKGRQSLQGTLKIAVERVVVDLYERRRWKSRVPRRWTLPVECTGPEARGCE